MSYGFCIWCGNNIPKEKEKKTGRKLLYCCFVHQNRHRSYKYHKAKSRKFTWKSYQEKNRFHATQRRMEIATDIHGYVSKTLKSMGDGQQADIAEPQPNPTDENVIHKNIILIQEHDMRGRDNVQLTTTITTDKIKAGDLLVITVKKYGSV